MIRYLSEIELSNNVDPLLGKVKILINLTEEEYEYYLEVTNYNYFTNRDIKDLIISERVYNELIIEQRNQKFNNLL